MENELYIKAMQTAQLLRQDIRDIQQAQQPANEAERYPVAMLARQAKWIEDQLAAMAQVKADT